MNFGRIIKLGYLAFVIQFIGLTIAISLYGDYDASENLSPLGARSASYSLVTGNLIGPAPHPEIFNLTIIISALILLCFPYMKYRFFLREGNPRERSTLIAILTIQQISYNCLLLLGIFDVGSFYNIHLASTLIFFYFGLLAFVGQAGWWLVFKRWDGVERLVFFQIVAIAIMLGLSILRQTSINNLFTEFYYFENGLYQKYWAALFAAINIIDLKIMQFRLAIKRQSLPSIKYDGNKA